MSHRVPRSIFVSLSFVFILGVAFAAPLFARNPDEVAKFQAQYAEFRNRDLSENAKVRADLLQALDMELAVAYGLATDGRDRILKKKIEAEFERVLGELSVALPAKGRIVGAMISPNSDSGSGQLILDLSPGEQRQLAVLRFEYKILANGLLRWHSGWH